MNISIVLVVVLGSSGYIHVDMYLYDIWVVKCELLSFRMSVFNE